MSDDLAKRAKDAAANSPSRDLLFKLADRIEELEAVKREARNEALREAISIVSGYGCCHVPDEIQDAILALMEGSDDE